MRYKINHIEFSIIIMGRVADQRRAALRAGNAPPAAAPAVDAAEDVKRRVKEGEIADIIAELTADVEKSVAQNEIAWFKAQDLTTRANLTDRAVWTKPDYVCAISSGCCHKRALRGNERRGFCRQCACCFAWVLRDQEHRLAGAAPL